MLVVRGLAAESSSSLSVDAVALGNFDGVHLGHRAVLDRAKRYGRAAVYTFRPHPAKVLAPDRAPALLESYDRKIERLRDAGVAVVIEEPFDAAFAARSAEVFLETLFGATKTRGIVVGADFTFGHRREGNVGYLSAWGARRRIDTAVVEPVLVDGGVVSSTRIRAALGAGDVALAARLLGRAPALRGVVVRGKERGRAIGFPTVNLATENEAIPKTGVYVAVAQLATERRRAVVNIGHAPTFGANALTVEAHLFDFARDIYGETVELGLVSRLRDERPFGDVAELRAQIAADCDRARAIALGEAI
ncbi:MAG: bifunctional riboflavin kinase/FAD synthetase [Deltaproteobacteria bacterium]|nr:bifunctional riboflavin kinase/FAD synthetase [Deltaproteobacteria bacterium]